MTLTPITDDIFQVRIPLPFALNHVNCYLLRDGDGWAMIDTGINTPTGQETWKAAFDELKIRPNQLKRIIVTHTHPDHFGMAGWFQALAAEDGADSLPVFLSEIEAARFDSIWHHMDEHRFADYLKLGGVTPDIVSSVAESLTHTLSMTYPHPDGFSVLRPGDSITIGERTFAMIHTPGHSDGHLIFYDADDKLMLSGDHVLMKITPNIGLWANSSENPLGEFIDSLRSLLPLDVRLALPGHRQLITDWHGRLQEILAHHDHRLSRCLEAVAAGHHTGYAIAGHIFDTSRFTVHEWRFAVAETLAHLEYLRLRGQLTRDGDPIWHYKI